MEVGFRPRKQDRKISAGNRREPNGGGIHGAGRFLKCHVAATTFVARHRCTNTLSLPNSATPVWQSDDRLSFSLSLYVCIYIYVYIYIYIYIPMHTYIYIYT